MNTQHANPAEAVQIAIDIGAQHLLGVHWATFQLTDEPWEEPAQLLEKAMREQKPANLTAQAFRPGDIWEAQTTLRDGGSSGLQTAEFRPRRG
jgi:L-ascorbate metabolism protein UlaG (beta-lactamase superfamily)